MGMKPIIATGALGYVLITLGIALINPPAAMVVAGAMLLALAWLALDALGAKQ